MSYYHQILVSRELGGAGMIALRLAAAIRDQGQESFVWLPGKGAAAAKANELRLHYDFYTAEKALTGSPIESALCNLRIGRLFRSRAPGIVHVHSPLYYGALSLGLKYSGLRTVVHVQLEEDKEGLQWAFKRAPCVIITCARFLIERVRSALPERRHNSQKIFAVPNAVDTDRFQPGDKMAAKLKVDVPPQIPLVLMVANLALHKGQETALRAAAILKERKVEAQFWFAGIERGGRLEYTNYLKVLTNELGIGDRVKFLGQRNDIPDLLQAADFFFLPSTSEGLPLSILEAQAAKVPVLAAPTAGIPEIIAHGKTGFLVSPCDATGYALQLYTLMRNPDLCKSIVERAFTNIQENYTWDRYVVRICDIYSKLLHN
jgi:glycosyltransferase involved in cell wall biosynthesis